MRTPLPLPMLIISVCSTLSSNAQSQSSQTTTVGPWEIATSYKADKFSACVMNRSAAGLGISFMRAQDGLLLVLDSPKWKLDRGKAYTVRLVAGSQSMEAKALAETRGVTVALADRPFNGKLRTATVLDVRGEGATLQVPLDGSAAAFERLEACFEKIVERAPKQIRSLHPIESLKPRSGSRDHHLRALIAKSAKGQSRRFDDAPITSSSHL
jgi:hypothetical protein